MKLDSFVALSRGLNPACPQSSAAKWCANDCTDAQVYSLILNQYGLIFSTNENENYLFTQ